MGRVLTNNTGFQYAIELTETNPNLVSVLPGEDGQPGSPTWNIVEVNSYQGIGAEIATVARDPISINRQNKKGTITDLDSNAAIDIDLTLSHFSDFAEGFVFASYKGVTQFDAVSVDTDSFTVAASDVLEAGTLVFSRGFANSVNNGLKVVGSGSTATDIIIANETLVAETASDNVALDVAGFRTDTGDLAVTDVTSNQVTITSSNNIFDAPGLDLRPGCALFFGGAGSTNRFVNSENQGYCQLVSVAGDGSNIVVKNTTQTWVTEAAGSQEVDFYAGKFLRNVSTQDSDFLERSFQFELSFDNLGVGGAAAYEYSKGNYCNTLGLSLPITDKATLSAAFIGTDTDVPTNTRKPNAGSAISPNKTTAFNTTQDFARLRIDNLDETGLTTDFKSVTLNLNNNVSAEKVLGNLGARFLNYGNFQVSIEAQVLFTEAAVVSAIRNNQTVQMSFALENEDGALYVNVPALTLGGGNKDYPVNETVLINLSGEAFADPVLNTSIGITEFPFVPDLS